MLNQRIVNEIESHVNKESDKCIGYAQKLFDLKDVPKILVGKDPYHKTEDSLHAAGRTLSYLVKNDVVINPNAVANSVETKTYCGYQWSIRDSTIDHLSEEIGHFMHRILIKEEFDNYLDIEFLRKDFYDKLVKRGVLEAVSFYNKVNTLSQYNLKDGYFEDKEIFDSALLTAISRNLGIMNTDKTGINILPIDELELVLAENISYESLFLGREIFEWEIKNMGTEEFREFVRKPLDSFEREKTEGYIVYFKTNMDILGPQIDFWVSNFSRKQRDLNSK